MKFSDFKTCEELPVGPQIYKWIREQIIFAKLVPGTSISEAEIAKECSLSRQPIREAFIRLKEENLLLIRPQRGTEVKKISIQSVMDGQFIREAVEADIVRILVEQKDALMIKQLRNQLEEQKKIKNTDAAGFLKLDEIFHRTLAEGAGKNKVWNFLETIKTHMDRVRFLDACRSDNRQLINQHEEIVRTIEGGNGNSAEKAMRNHLRKILVDLPEMQKVRPELFEE